ncbi:MAG: ABC transporter substrate-binding protein [Chloroflexi bacterium]|nr:ABC transporter substrate-binding protein [Chloroflexota bacterium]
MKRKVFYTLFVLLIVTSMLLSACAAPAEAPTETEVEPEATEEVVEESEEPVETEVGKDTFIFGRGADSVQLDPVLVTDGESFRVTGQVLDSLYAFELGTTNPVPSLAECTANEDASVWACKLREGVKFHDGTDFNADAVIFNFERWRFTDNPYHYPSQVFEYYEAMWGGFDDASIITEVKKIDDLNIEFVLSSPMAPFLANLAMDMFAISSPAAIQAAGEAYGTPNGGCVGTGPYKFVSWQEGTEIVLVANEDYWGEPAKVKNVIVRVIPDDSARFLALQAGDIDALEQAVVEDLATAEADPTLQILTRPALNTSYIAFNFKILEFQDARVREAVAHAIDKEGLISNFFGKYGSVATNFLPPLLLGHNADIQDWTYDPELSKSLLADAGFPEGLTEVTVAEDVTDADGNVLYTAGQKIPLRLYYMPVTRFYFPAAKEVGEGMAANLNAAGFNVELYLEGDWPTYLGGRRNGTLMGLYLLGWGGDNGDPDNFLGYFYSSGAEPIMREGWYQNADLAAILQEAVTLPDPEARAALYRQAEQMLHDDIARIWLGHNNTPLILSATVQGYTPQPVGAENFEHVFFSN